MDITLEYLESLIKKENFFRVGKKTVVCVLTLKNGFEVVAYSGVLNPEKFDKAAGEAVAYDKAIDKLWELEGYKRQDEVNQ